MKNQTILLIALLVIGVIAIAIGIYAFFYKPEPQILIKEIPKEVIKEVPVKVESNKQVVFSKRIEIPATKMWVDTGLDVTEKTVDVEVESGQWKNHPNSGWNAGEGRGPYHEQSLLLVPNANLSAR